MFVILNLFSKKDKFESSGSVEYIVVGLGNPDKKYERTRHNAGFIAVDTMSERLGCELKTLKFKSYCTTTTISGKKVLLMKPQTYMNNSGEAVVQAMNFYKVNPQNVIVILDDISLDVGKMRIRRKGTDGGQRGMANIIYLSGSDMFPRIKLGIGAKPHPDYNLADWVLSKFSDDEYKTLLKTCENALPAVEHIIAGNIDKAMNLFN
ncbi:MAG: aminoacyl-tRNA hydrolase [Clostridia bacterium]|nr:aminoacyl-tRNA hydrolase [Clostridia bacterium]